MPTEPDSKVGEGVSLYMPGRKHEYLIPFLFLLWLFVFQKGKKTKTQHHTTTHKSL